MARRTRASARSAPRTVARGERVCLREPARTDGEELLALRAASREFLAPWEPELPGVDFASPAFFERYLRCGPRFRRRRLLICSNQGGAILGSISLSEIDAAEGRAVLGYWIGAPHARRGYMSEALRLVVGVAAAELGVSRLEAFVLPENRPSKLLLAKLGFAHVGTAPEYRVIRGAARNHERWELGLLPGATCPSRAGSGSPG